MPGADRVEPASQSFSGVWAGASTRTRIYRHLEGGEYGYRTVDGPATPQDFLEHLVGEFCLGLVPVTEHGQCRWAGIDIDADTIDHAALAGECGRRRLPLIACRSKSGGAHLFLFLHGPLPARFVRKKLKEYARALGYPDAEIFPKQDRLRNDGSAIALPYTSGNRSTEYALRPDGTSMPLSEFIETVEHQRVTDKAQLDDVDLTDTPPTEPAGPSTPTGPSATGTKKIPAGSRVNTLVSRIGRLCRQGVMPSGIKADIAECNNQWCDPPLTTRELEQEVLPAIERFAADRPPAGPAEVIPLHFTSSTELLAQGEADDTDWLVRQLIPRMSHSLVTARPKEGKSLTLQQLCFEAALGKPVFGDFQVVEPIRCLYADYAQGRAETKRRHLQMVKAYPDQTLIRENLVFQTKEDLRRSKTLASELADLGNSRSTEFSDWLIEQRIQLLVIAEIRSLVKLGGNLNDQDVAEMVNGWVEWLQSKTGITVVAIHHSRKTEAQTGEAEAFGSTMLTAAPDAIISLKRRPSGLRRVHIEARFDALADFLLELQNTETGGRLLRVVEDPEQAINRKIVELDVQGVTNKEIAKEVGLSVATIKRKLQEARKEAEKAEDAKETEPEFEF